MLAAYILATMPIRWLSFRRRCLRCIMHCHYTNVISVILCGRCRWHCNVVVKMSPWKEYIYMRRIRARLDAAFVFSTSCRNENCIILTCVLQRGERPAKRNIGKTIIIIIHQCVFLTKTFTPGPLWIDSFV